MNNDAFKYYLKKTNEVGFVDQVHHSLVYVSGIPKARPGELVIFENGGNGQVLSLSEVYAEVLLLPDTMAKVGEEVARTGETLQVAVGEGLLGRLIDPLGRSIDGKGSIKNAAPSYIDKAPPSILERKNLEYPLETGVTVVDMVIPLAKGQRELIIGDRKTGKTEFLLQTMTYQAKRGTICIYALIGQRMGDVQMTYDYVKSQAIDTNTIIVAATSSQAAGLIYLTPYTAMTIAEYFCSQGKDVLLILDDLTNHARVYREISLLAKRFPGRSSFPGDIFFLHAKIVERAGNFLNGSITCLPVAESILGDMSGYIQTNLMSMTDGHLYFDIDMYNRGVRPSVNPFLSVTRVGRQVQSALVKETSRELSSFLVNYERLRSFSHFGTEVGESTQQTLKLGEKVSRFLMQRDNVSLPLQVSVLLFTGLMSGIWNERDLSDFTKDMEDLYKRYEVDQNYKKAVDECFNAYTSFKDLSTHLKADNTLLKGGV